MDKVVLISGSTIDLSPYIRSYVNLFEQHGISFDFIYWNRYLAPIDGIPTNFIPYNKHAEITDPSWKKIIDLLKFRRFVRKALNEKHYSFAIVFTIAEGLFLEPLLINRFKKRYVFDIRDFSPLCKIKLCYKKLTSLIKQSSFTVVSSEGFLNWLPQDRSIKYVIAHNTRKEIIETYNNSLPSIPVSKYRVLTIGQIRDTAANKKIISELGNNSKFELIFAGFGMSVDDLREFKERNHYNNVLFTGKYKKEDEDTIVGESDMINIYFTHGINSDTLMSNRFYLSVLHRKPMIVTGGTFQAALVEKYALGVIVNDNDVLIDKIEHYWKCFKAEEYEKGCLAFLQSTLTDIQNWEHALIELLRGGG